MSHGTALREIARSLAGAQLGLKLELCSSAVALLPDQQVIKVLSPLKSQHKFVEFEFFLKSVTDTKFEPSEVRFQMLMPQTVSEWQRLPELDLSRRIQHSVQQDCHSQITQVEYQGQTQYTRILESKLFITLDIDWS